MSEVVLHSKLRELAEELRTEREVRFRHDKELMSAKIDLDDVDFQLQEALAARDREAEENRKLRQDYAQLRLKYEALLFENEEFNSTFKNRNQTTIVELTSHVESLSKSKQKYEKDNKTFLLEIDTLRSENDSLSRSKAQAQALVKELEDKEIEYLKRIDEILKQLSESNELRNKISNESSDYKRRVEKLEFELNQVNINVKRYTQELDDARLQLENEILFRAGVETKLKNLQFDLSSANASLDAAYEERDDFQKQLSRANEELRSVREQCSKDIEAKNEELEDVKRRLNSKYLEIQDQLTETVSKLSNIEKIKSKLQIEVETLIVEVDRARKKAEEASRHEKQLEKEVEDYRNRLSAVNAELEAALTANRNYSIEIAKAKNLSEQLNEQLEISIKEKRRISEELESVNNLYSDSQTRLIDLERRAKAIDAERIQIQMQLEDTRDLLQAEIVKYTNLSQTYERYRIDIEKRLADKEEELDALRIAHRRQLEQMQENIEAIEVRYKSEISSIKKKYLIEIEEFKARFELLKRQFAESEANLKKYQLSYKEVSDKLVEEQHAHDADREALIAAEKRASSLRGEVEELKVLLDRSEKSRKVLELELHDSESRYADIQVQLNRVIAERKKFEADYIECYDSLHEIRIELKSSEERARIASAAVVKKDEEIRHERELAHEIDAARKVLEQQLREAQLRIEESEEYARKESRRIAAKYEGRLAQLESDLDLEKSKSQDYIKEIRRLEKRSKELATQVEEEQTKVISLTDSHEKLQEKMRKYRGQIEGAEGQVAINISRCRRLQRELEDAEDRAETMTRTFLRSGSSHRAVEGGEEVISSAIEEYSNAITSSSTARNQTPSYLRSSYLYSKPSQIEDYSGNYSRASSIAAWRPRFTTVDLDDEDVPVKSSAKYSSSSYYASSSSQHQPREYRSEYMRTRESSRSRFSNKLKRHLRGLSV